ncbi:hypothetical protein F5Y18DRAFT_438113 [Xylariaceae sp. FL1019]|nr:hypothetical protein F5Y18DRAFT_438113 [Xylariaceae sp. FL1019]
MGYNAFVEEDSQTDKSESQQAGQGLPHMILNHEAPALLWNTPSPSPATGTSSAVNNMARLSYLWDRGGNQTNDLQPVWTHSVFPTPFPRPFNGLQPNSPQQRPVTVCRETDGASLFPGSTNKLQPSTKPFTGTQVGVTPGLHVNPAIDRIYPRPPELYPIDDLLRGSLIQMASTVSPNYQGDPYLKANQSANIPDHLNTAVWITNLPPHLDHKMLLGNIRNCGKIWAAVVNEPEAGHITSAAKVVFWDVTGAEHLLRQSVEGKFIVGDYIPRVRRNRIKSEAKPPGVHSRVLHIEGPSYVVNQAYLAAFFSYNDIKWEDEAIITLMHNGNRTRLEWRFGSYRCQAESARHAIDRVKRPMNPVNQFSFQLWQDVSVYFGVDPCAPRLDMIYKLLPSAPLPAIQAPNEAENRELSRYFPNRRDN